MTRVENQSDLEAAFIRNSGRAESVIAIRAALRVLPAIHLDYSKFNIQSDERMDMYLNIFRKLSSAWTVLNYKNPSKNIVNCVSVAAEASISPFLNIANSIAGSYSAANAARSATFSSRQLSFDLPNQTGVQAVKAAISSAGAIDYPTEVMWKFIELDIQQVDAELPLPSLLFSPLWNKAIQPDFWAGDAPIFWSRIWSGMRSYLLETDNNWDVWIDWYEDRLAGKRPREKAVRIFRVTLNEDADWEKGPIHVNALIKAKITEGRQIDGVKHANNKADGAAQVSEGNSPAIGKTAVSKPVQTSKPRSTGKIASKNRFVIQTQIDSVCWFIDDRITRIKNDWTVNDRSSMDEEIEELETWKALLRNVDYAVDNLVDSGDEQGIETIAGELRQALIKFLKSKGTATIDLGARSAIFSGVLVVGALCGVPLPTALISGAIVGGKPVTQMIEQVWGGVKSLRDKLAKRDPEPRP